MNIAHETERRERRRSPRNGHVIEGWLSPHHSEDRTEVTTFDLSRHGVSFDTTFAMAVGTEFIYEIGVGTQTLYCDIRVVNCQLIADAIWHVGAEFI